MKANCLKKTLPVLAILMLLAATLLACGTATPEPEAPTTEASYDTTTQPTESTVPDDPYTSPRTAVTGLLADPERAWTEITIAISSWSAEREELVWDERSLSPEDAQRVHQLLSTVQAEAILTPTHGESMQVDPSHRVRIMHDGETIETVYAIQEGARFFRFTDTVGSSNDPGFIWVESAALQEILAAYS